MNWILMKIIIRLAKNDNFLDEVILRLKGQSWFRFLIRDEVERLALNKIRKEANNAYEDFVKKYNSEEFLEGLIERINKKQIRS